MCVCVYDQITCKLSIECKIMAVRKRAASYMTFFNWYILMTTHEMTLPFNSSKRCQYAAIHFHDSCWNFSIYFNNEIFFCAKNSLDHSKVFKCAKIMHSKIIIIISVSIVFRIHLQLYGSIWSMVIYNFQVQRILWLLLIRLNIKATINLNNCFPLMNKKH